MHGFRFSTSNIESPGFELKNSSLTYKTYITSIAPLRTSSHETQQRLIWGFKLRALFVDIKNFSCHEIYNIMEFESNFSEGIWFKTREGPHIHNFFRIFDWAGYLLSYTQNTANYLTCQCNLKNSLNSIFSWIVVDEQNLEIAWTFSVLPDELLFILNYNLICSTLVDAERIYQIMQSMYGTLMKAHKMNIRQSIFL